jgi:hypothetical protein
MIHSLRTQVVQPWAQKRLWRAITWSAFVLLLIPTAYTQTASSISGTVLDTANALVPSAKVTLTNEANKGVRVVTSNGTGFFDFAAVQPGIYTIEIVKAGFETWSVTGIEVHPGDSLTVPKIKLVIGTVTQSVTVTAEVAGVTQNSGEHSTLITSADINRLSTTGRDAAELVSMLPGFALDQTSMQNQGADYTTVGFGSGNVGAWGVNGAAPQQGLVSVTSDGANVIDPGDMGGQVSNINMDQVQEVKVQTSNFGADEAKGPVVINAVGKAGSDTFHGGVYDYFRNAGLNTNDWLSKYVGTAKSAARYDYPGGSIGGPVIIPGTHFNSNKHLIFWAGYEYYLQSTNANNDTPVTMYVPTAGQLAGDLSADTMASKEALNVPGGASAMAAGCPADWNVSAAYSDIAALCYSAETPILNGTTNVLYDQFGNPVPTTGILPSSSIDPGIAAYTRFYPAANRTPRPIAGLGEVSDGYNYVKNVMASHNGFQFHTRVDENISDTLKLYGTFNWEKMNDEEPLQYNYGGAGAPLPSPVFSNASAQYLTLNLTKVVKSTMTNELVASGVYFNAPEQFANKSAVSATGTAWDTAGYTGGINWQGNSIWQGGSAATTKNGNTQLARMYTYESTPMIPWYSLSNIPTDTGWFLRKFSWNVADNFTWQYKTHSIKFGVYGEQTANNQSTAGSQVNGDVTFARWDSCHPNQTYAANTTPTLPVDAKGNTIWSSLDNELGNFLIGCTQSYNQANIDPNNNLRFISLEGYITDEWKVNSKLTLTVGARFTHLGPWTDPHGIGMAVWQPSTIQQHVIYTDTTTPGMSWHKLDSSIPNAGVPTKAVFVSPRFGLAYDVFGNGKTTLRGGWGVYYSHDSTSIASGANGTAIGMTTYSPNTSYGCTFGQLFTKNYFPCDYYSAGTTKAGLIGSNAKAYAMDPNDDQVPTTYNYNFTIDQQGPFHSVLELAYVGNQSTHLSTLGALQNQNVIPLGAEFGPDPAVDSPNYGQTQPAYGTGVNYADYRPYPNYQYIYVANHTNWANYNALQASWNKQRGALVFGLNYTKSKSLGVRGNYDTGYVADPVVAQHDYGILSFDRPQAFNASYSYVEGVKFHGNRILGQVINNWEISGITGMQSGADLAVLNNSTNYGLAGAASYTPSGSTSAVSLNLNANAWLGSEDYNVQPIVKCDPRKGLQKNQFVNGACFGIPALGTQGAWTLPDTHGPAYFKSDLSIYKDFTINDRQNMQFRLSAFNFMNHPITSFASSNLSNLYLIAGYPTGAPTYNNPSDALTNLTITNAANFGSTIYKVGERIVELGFKYNF